MFQPFELLEYLSPFAGLDKVRPSDNWAMEAFAYEDCEAEFMNRVPESGLKEN